MFAQPRHERGDRRIQVARPGQACAHPSSRPARTAGARTRNWPSDSSAAVIATAGREALRGSTPIITTAMTGIPFRYPMG